MSEEYHFNHRRLSTQIFLALIAGLITGLLINFTLGEVAWVQTWVVDGLFAVVGDIFIRLLSMLIVPVVFVSLVAGVASLSDPKMLGRVGSKALGLYVITTAIAVILALLAAVVFQPGVGASPIGVAAPDIAEIPPLSQVLLDIVPRNPVEAMIDGNMLAIIVFSIMFGLAMSFAGEPGRRVGAFFIDLMDVVMKLVGIVMLIAPYGVFALLAAMAANTGWGTFAGVLKYVLLVFGMLILQAALVYPALLKALSGLNPVTFYRQFRDVLAFAFSTASSGATIPVTLRAVQERMGASPRIASFTIPLGATINMDGTAIMQGIAVGFIAQYYGVDLSLTQYAIITLMVVMASIGTAGVPGVGLVMLAGVLTQVGLPVEGVALILGVDRVLDMTRTAVNVTGDATVTCIVAKHEGELDIDRFNTLDSDNEPETDQS